MVSKTNKFSILFLGCIFISVAGLLSRLEITEATLFDFGSPHLCVRNPVDPFKSRRVVRTHGGVLCVLFMSANPQVAFTVIQRIAVDVINFNGPDGYTHGDSVHSNTRKSSSFGSNWTGRIALSFVREGPFERAQVFKVFVINNADFALGETYFFHDFAFFDFGNDTSFGANNES